MSEIKTRFAPSPTGHLHIGGARTALFNWLYARHFGGKFVLRIEDTDTARSTQESVDAILDGMTWLGLDWDEGPYYQSERRDIYLEHIEKMLTEGKAYRCYCSSEELDKKREKALSEGEKPKYDGTCRELASHPEGKPYTIRFKAPDSGVTVVEDMIKGKVSFDNSELDDLIIARSDGSPTYNFVVVVDDVTMGITHILRGDDHLNNTPRQILLYNALGYKPPVFGHLPLILGQDKKRLSKRHGATSVMAYREMGYLPSAIVNFLVRLGWSHGDQEIFSKDELVKLFNADQIGKSAGIFNEEKLLWLNAHYIKESTDKELAEGIMPLLAKKGLDIEDGPALASVVPGLKERAKTTTELAEMAEFYYKKEVDLDEEAARKFLTPESCDILKDIISGLEGLKRPDEEAVEGLFKEIAERKGIKLGKIAQPVRVALTGGTVSPSIFGIIALMGKEKTVERIRRALEKTG